MGLCHESGVLESKILFVITSCICLWYTCSEQISKSTFWSGKYLGVIFLQSEEKKKSFFENRISSVI